MISKKKQNKKKKRKQKNKQKTKTKKKQKKKKKNKGKRKVQRVPQSHTAALPRYQEEEETDKFKQAQIEQTYEKH